MTHHSLELVQGALAAVAVAAGWGLGIMASATQDTSILDVAKVAPSFIATVLVIFVVVTFLRHLRSRDLDRERREVAFSDMLVKQREAFDDMLVKQREAFDQALRHQGEETTRSLETLADRNADAMEKVSNNLERLVEGQARISEAIHSCIRRGA